MITAKERLNFVFNEFLKMDLTTLTSGDWVNLKDRLRMFLGVQFTDQQDKQVYAQRCGYSPLEDPVRNVYVSLARKDSDTKTIKNILMDTSLEELTVLQKTVRLLLPKIKGGGGIKSVSLNIDLLASSQRLFVNGSLHDVFIYLLLAEDFQARDADRILNCPQCGEVFYKLGKMKYCSRRCTNRANVKKHYDRKKAVKKRKAKK